MRDKKNKARKQSKTKELKPKKDPKGGGIGFTGGRPKGNPPSPLMPGGDHRGVADDSV